jgi:hypothetical protein
MAWTDLTKPIAQLLSVGPRDAMRVPMAEDIPLR